MVYLLAVVGAALIAGWRGGLVASVLSFLGLNFFFTPPFHTWAVERSEDVVALVVFLAVSSLVAALFSNAVRQRSRAERREHEAWLLYQISSRLLRGAPLNEALKEFARNLVELFQLEGCEIHLRGRETTDLALEWWGRDAPEKLAPKTISLRTERGEFGELRIFPSPEAPLGEVESGLTEAFANQLALAVEGARLAEEARVSQGEAEASRIRAALFSSVTHDLKTPLASIKASASSLLEEGVKFSVEQGNDLLQTIVEESDRLNVLIGNLLDLSRVRAGALIPQKIPTPIEDVIESVVARLHKSFDSRPVRIKVREDLPPVPMDLIQIDQVLTNLIENGIKYSPSSSPIEITAAKDQAFVEVAVADHGRGIPSEDRERVFEEFYRGGGDDGHGGSGLGLAIARAVVQAHGGTISIAQTPGGGTTVKFRLPIGPR
jgi:two-component system sensor histidine kinase KdpD